MLPPNYIIRSLLESNYSLHLENHHLSLETLTVKQDLEVRSSIVNANNRLNEVFNSFDPFNNKLSSRNRLIDLYSSHSFYHSDRKGSNTRKTHLCYLDEIVFNVSSNPKMAVVISDASIKNQVTTSITHMYTHDSPIVKTINHTINATFTEAELFAIRCRLNQAIWLTNIKHIIVITDAIYAAKRIFDSSIHLYQI